MTSIYNPSSPGAGAPQPWVNQSQYNPWAGVEDLRDKYPGVFPDDLRRFKANAERARLDEAADRFRRDSRAVDPYLRTQDRMRQEATGNDREQRELAERWNNSPAGQQPLPVPRFGNPAPPPPRGFGGTPWRGAPGGFDPRPGGPGARLPTPIPGSVGETGNYTSPQPSPAPGAWGGHARAAGLNMQQYSPQPAGGYRPGMAQPIAPPSQGTPYGAPSPFQGFGNDVVTAPPSFSGSGGQGLGNPASWPSAPFFAPLGGGQNFQAPPMPQAGRPLTFGQFWDSKNRSPLLEQAQANSDAYARQRDFQLERSLAQEQRRYQQDMATREWQQRLKQASGQTQAYNDTQRQYRMWTQARELEQRRFDQAWEQRRKSL